MRPRREKSVMVTINHNQLFLDIESMEHVLDFETSILPII